MKTTTLVTALFITGLLVAAATAMTDDAALASSVCNVVFLMVTSALSEPFAVVRFTAFAAVVTGGVCSLVAFKMSNGGRAA